MGGLAKKPGKYAYLRGIVAALVLFALPPLSPPAYGDDGSVDSSSGDSGGGSVDSNSNGDSGSGDNPDNTAYTDGSSGDGSYAYTDGSYDTAYVDPGTSYPVADFTFGDAPQTDTTTTQANAQIAAAHNASSGSSREMAVSVAAYAEGLKHLAKNPALAGVLFQLGADSAEKGLEFKTLELKGLDHVGKLGKEIPKAKRDEAAAVRADARTLSQKAVADEIRKEENVYDLGKGGLARSVIKGRGQPARVAEELGGKLKPGAIDAALEAARNLDPKERETLLRKTRAGKLAESIKAKREKLREMLADIDPAFTQQGSAATLSPAFVIAAVAAAGRAPASAPSRAVAPVLKPAATAAPDFRNLTARPEEFFGASPREEEASLFAAVNAKYRNRGLLRRLGL